MYHLTTIDKSYRISLGKKFTELLKAKPGDYIIILSTDTFPIIRKGDAIAEILKELEKAPKQES